MTDSHSPATTTDTFSAIDRLWRLVNQMRPDEAASVSPERLAALRQLVGEVRRVAEARKLQREHYRALVEQTLDAILVVDGAHLVLDANHRACEMLNYSREELLQRQMRHLVPLEDWNGFLHQLEHSPGALRERRMLRRDTSPLAVEVTLARLEGGRYQVVARDISERRQIEAARRENELRLQALVAALDDILFEFDADGTYIDVQTRNLTLLRESPASLIGQTLSEVLEPEMAGRILEVIRRVLATGQPESLEYAVQWPDHTRWFLARISPLAASNSFVKTAVMLARDITARKTAEEQLAQNAAEIAALYRAAAQLLAPAGDVSKLAHHIAESVIREFDFAACSVFLSVEAGATLRRLATVGDMARESVEALAVPGPGLTVAAFQNQHTVYVPDVRTDVRYVPGNPTTRSELAVPLVVGTRAIGVLDLQSPELDAFSERARHIVEVYAEQAALALENMLLLENLDRARAAAEEANRLKSMFLANTSHELRTPLAVIIGGLDAILSGFCPPEDVPKMLQTAHTASQRLQYLISDLLDFAKIEAGRLDLSLEAIDLVPILNQACLFVRPLAEKKNLKLETYLPEAPPPLVWADAFKVEQILLNIIGNGVKFTEQGSVVVRLDIDWEAPRCLQITVQDTGIGVALEKQGKLFQPFVQADGSSTRRYGGTGLGLSLSRRLAELMGGTLMLYSDGEGHGTRLTLRLPLAEDIQPEPAALEHE